MSRRRRWSPGELLCLPPASDAHPFDAVSLDLPSDVARASLSGVPNSFYLPADRTHSSDEGVKCPSRRLHGPSRPDTALCPLISRGWRPVGPVRRLRDLSHCRQLGSSLPGLQPRCSSIGGHGSPVPSGEPSLGLGWTLPDRSPQNPEVHSSSRWGLTIHAKPLPQSKYAPPARLSITHRN